MGDARTDTRRSESAWLWEAMLPPAFEVEGARPPSCPPDAADVRRLGELAVLHHRMDSEAAWRRLDGTEEPRCQM